MFLSRDRTGPRNASVSYPRHNAHIISTDLRVRQAFFDYKLYQVRDFWISKVLSHV